MDLSVVPYDHYKSQGESQKNSRVGVADPGRAGEIRYWECLRNHAASMGGHTNDGCGEFMAGGGKEEIKCAACGCHRNFHRKEVSGVCGYQNHLPILGFDQKRLGFEGRGFHGLLPAPPAAQIGFQSVGRNRRSEGDVRIRKRMRTKFTQEQKDKMVDFAEKLGWRIHKEDDAELHQFCMDVGVNRHVLRVWMHNNKNTLGKKEGAEISV